MKFNVKFLLFTSMLTHDMKLQWLEFFSSKRRRNSYLFLCKDVLLNSLVRDRIGHLPFGCRVGRRGKEGIL